MRRMLPALLLALVVPVLTAVPAHADVIPDECVYVMAGGGALGYQPTVTVCRP